MKDMNGIIDQAENILKRKSIDGYEIFIEESSSFEVESKDQKVDTLQASRSWGMAFRVLNRQRMGFSYTTFPCSFIDSNRDVSDGIKQVIEDAIASAEVTTQDPCFDFAPMPIESLPDLPISDDSLKDISEKTKIEKAKSLEEATRAVDPEELKR